eukprot:CAMPEP_0117442894 /NCGR_PEP_ID=MMETSP0759-20121206/4399_1 /TAXON_ID=63605 /ORGANISM="Percolomonas cosmopolitus, Strain WS" /LENGTH=540 /DNA_ID=CAMNT_0005234821 /DNA_START=60 /DNA_END=1679 /DNA_ORIENTATION=-
MPTILEFLPSWKERTPGTPQKKPSSRFHVPSFFSKPKSAESRSFQEMVKSEKKIISIADIQKYMDANKIPPEKVVKIHFWVQNPSAVFHYVHSYRKVKSVEFLDTADQILMCNNLWLKKVELQKGDRTECFFSLKHETSASRNTHFIEFETKSFKNEGDAYAAVTELLKQKGVIVDQLSKSGLTRFPFTLTEYYFAQPAIPADTINMDDIESFGTYCDLKLEHMHAHEFEYCKFSLRINSKTDPDFLSIFAGPCYGANSGIIEYLLRNHNEKILLSLYNQRSITFLEYDSSARDAARKHCTVYEKFHEKGKIKFVYSLQEKVDTEHIVFLDTDLSWTGKKDELKNILEPSNSSVWCVKIPADVLKTADFSELLKKWGSKLVWLHQAYIDTESFPSEDQICQQGVAVSREDFLLQAQLFYLQYYHQFRLLVKAKDLSTFGHGIRDHCLKNDVHLKSLPEQKQQDKILERLYNHSLKMRTSSYQLFLYYLQYLALSADIEEGRKRSYCTRLVSVLQHFRVSMNPRRYLVEEQIKRLDLHYAW